MAPARQAIERLHPIDALAQHGSTGREEGRCSDRPRKNDPAWRSLPLLHAGSWRFRGDHHVVHVALAQAGGGDAREACSRAASRRWSALPV